MNLPNTLTVARILATPLIAWLPFVQDWRWRLVAFVLFIAAAVTDYWDGHLARTRGLITDLGKQLDPLADKLLLVGTFIPMFILTGSGLDGSLASPWQRPLVPGVLGPMLRDDGGAAFPVHVPFEGTIGLPWWVLA
ncbi:MAG TPA: CDP-alcohol phosphatidyltransferase family protein, partial [Gemmatimonadaceae bacterium]